MCLILSVVLSGESEAEAKARKSGSGTAAERKEQRSAFRKFQLQYLAVYLITMLADWLQGTNMYTLYRWVDG